MKFLFFYSLKIQNSKLIKDGIFKIKSLLNFEMLLSDKN